MYRILGYLTTLYQLYQMIRQGGLFLWTWKDWVGRGCGLFQSTVLIFSWRNWRKQRKLSGRIAGLLVLDSNLGHPEYKARVLTTQQRRSVTCQLKIAITTHNLLTVTHRAIYVRGNAIACTCRTILKICPQDLNFDRITGYPDKLLQ
jgi:hypothetical protein